MHSILAVLVCHFGPHWSWDQIDKDRIPHQNRIKSNRTRRNLTFVRKITLFSRREQKCDDLMLLGVLVHVLFSSATLQLLWGHQIVQELLPVGKICRWHDCRIRGELCRHLSSCSHSKRFLPGPFLFHYSSVVVFIFRRPIYLTPSPKSSWN